MLPEVMHVKVSMERSVYKQAELTDRTGHFGIVYVGIYQRASMRASKNQ